MSTLPTTAPATPAIDRLCTACWSGDLPAADAAIADGAIVNDEGRAPGWDSILPLYAALVQQHRDIVVWLLCGHGADPNGTDVMYFGAKWGTAVILQVLIDAGGDVNQACYGEPLLFVSISNTCYDSVHVLLGQPLLDCATTDSRSRTPEMYARYNGKRVVARRIAEEVSMG